MNHYFTNLMLTCVSGLLLLSSPISAQNLKDMRFQVPVSTLTETEEKEQHDQYAVPEDNSGTKSDEQEEVVQFNSQQSFDCQACQNTMAYNIALKYKGFVTTIDDIHELFMADGSIWEIHPADKYKLKLFAPNDSIIVTQLGGQYKYLLVNSITKDFLRANLAAVEPPFRGLTITMIDQTSRTMQLSDGSRWSITSWDDYMYYSGNPKDLTQRRWLETDMVIVGLNTDWLAPSWWNPYPRTHFIIDINLNKIVRVKLIN